MYTGYLTDVKGVKVGHSSNYEAMTGCSVVLFDKGAVGGIDVRGSAPGTRETNIFEDKKTVNTVHGIVLSGGSAFGLDSASGVMKYLEEKDLGFDVGVTKVPIVPAAVIFDLSIGDYRVRPDSKMGYEACINSRYNENRQGNIGAGVGATVGKLMGENYSMKGGLGSASLKIGDLIVSGMVSVNCVGDVFDYQTGKQLAGPFCKDKKKLYSTYEIMKSGFSDNLENRNTTIGIVVTNAKLDKAQANKLAEVSHNGFARSINPIHTSMDGDTIFAAATQEVEANLDLVCTMGSEVMSMAITNAILSAERYKEVLSFKDVETIMK